MLGFCFAKVCCTKTFTVYAWSDTGNYWKQSFKITSIFSKFTFGDHNALYIAPKISIFIFSLVKIVENVNILNCLLSTTSLNTFTKRLWKCYALKKIHMIIMMLNIIKQRLSNLTSIVSLFTHRFDLRAMPYIQVEFGAKFEAKAYWFLTIRGVAKTLIFKNGKRKRNKTESIRYMY